MKSCSFSINSGFLSERPQRTGRKSKRFFVITWDSKTNGKTQTEKIFSCNSAQVNLHGNSPHMLNFSDWKVHLILEFQHTRSQVFECLHAFSKWIWLLPDCLFRQLQSIPECSRTRTQLAIECFSEASHRSDCDIICFMSWESDPPE
jgi:hypothetical protein